MCRRCGATAGDRLLWLYLARELRVFEQAWRVLHILPTPALRSRFGSLPALHYSPVADPADAPAGRFDLVLCDRLYLPETMHTLAQALAPRGYAIVDAPADELRALGFTVLVDHYTDVVQDGARFALPASAALKICLPAADDRVGCSP